LLDCQHQIARTMTPPGYELVVADVGTPKFYDVELLRTSDIVSLHVPLDDTTRAMIHRSFATPTCAGARAIV
jgi:phosphoglycerate dehydrogenase-like enzyme